MCEDAKSGVTCREKVAAEGAFRPRESETHQWFALAVKPRFDKAVARALERKGFETLVPLYKKVHHYGARAKVSELPLFPGYVCCRFELQTRLPVLTTPGVIQVLGAGNVPTPLSDVEIHSLRTAIDAELPIQPFPFVGAGRRVRIKGGALAGVEGIVVECAERLRVVLSITLLQRSVLLEIDRGQLCVEEVGVQGVPAPFANRAWSLSNMTRFESVQGA
jgi:transcription antitermination factor NusG